MMNTMFMMELRPRKGQKLKIITILIKSWPPQLADSQSSKCKFALYPAS